MTLDSLINHHAQHNTKHTALIFANKKYTWQDFAKLVNQLSNAMLSFGIKKGDKVAIILPNCLELITLYWATISIGAVIVPLSHLLQKRGIISLLQNSDSKIVFLKKDSFKSIANDLCELPLVEKYVLIDSSKDSNKDNSNKDNYKDNYKDFILDAKDTPPATEGVKAEDLFNIIFSSGTTGVPKGIEHTHEVRSNYCLCFGLALRMSPESVVLHSGSIVFNGAFVDLLPSFYLGATYILHESFEAEEVIESIMKYKVTHTIMVPSQIVALLESPNATKENLSSLEMLMTIGAPLMQKDKNKLINLLPNRFYELYGLTEGFISILDRKDAPKKPKSVGTPPVGFKTKIVDNNGEELPCGQTGEIIGRGPVTMNGYYKNKELTEKTIKAGWIYTGDLGYLDKDGFLFLAGRKKDMIISGGINVYPADIEEVISSHKGVLESCVLGIESEKWGEVPIAFVILKRLIKIDKEELLDWVNENVASKYQRLQDIIFIKDMPRNIAGKILKHELKKMYNGN